MLGTNVIPHIAVRPVHDWIANALCLQSAVFKQPPRIVIIVTDCDFAAYDGGLFLVNTAVLAALGAFRPADACCYHTAFAALLFQHGTAVSHNACRRHEFLRYQAPHCHALTFICRQIDGTLDTLIFQPPEGLSHMVDGLRRVGRGMIVLYLVADARRTRQRKARIAIFTARCGDDERLGVVGFAHLRGEAQPLDGLVFLIHGSLHSTCISARSCRRCSGRHLRRTAGYSCRSRRRRCA